MGVARHHAEWRSLIEVSGPFLALNVLESAFPQGLDKKADESPVRERLKVALEEWEEAGGDPAIHRAFIDLVLGEVLGFTAETLAEGQSLPKTLTTTLAEHGETLAPNLALVSPDGGAEAGRPRLLVTIVPPGQGLERPLEGARWKASPATRAMELQHATGVRLGLVTNGEHWMLVHAPTGETSSFASFYASVWIEELLTLRAFRALLGVDRFFGRAESETLEALFAESAKNQHEITDQLGYQVRRAVEVLIQAIDRVDRDKGRELLRGADEKRLYEAAVTVMMRLVFLLTAEARELLPGKPEFGALYDAHYAVSTLREQLREVADRQGEEVLERRHDAWSRLLATFRAVHAGIQHDLLRLPAYGGSLFDPDRFPFLEGRADGTLWRDAPAEPLPLHNRTVLHLLEALQLLAIRIPGGGTETQRLSFRAIDVEQIGHVYEGLLDHTAVRARGVVLGLTGTKDLEPEIAVAELDEARKKGDEALVELLRESTGKSEPAVRKALAYQVPKEDRRLLTACENVAPVYKRVERYAGLLRDDTSGYPVVYTEGSVYVTQGTDRRSTGTHYTPKTLTEPIVRYTLEPLVYAGPAEGKPREAWRLKSPRELLALRVCDIAMGSGAFLVQACRYLAERLVEAWHEAEARGGGRLVVTPEGELATGAPSERPLPRDLEERLTLARRYVADRCLYGVDKNPMAVEMAKLSLWLVTLQRDRPFTFVDHALRCGDSLLGLTTVPQLEQFHVEPRRGATLPLGADVFRSALMIALEKRLELEGFSIQAIRDSEEKARLLSEAEKAIAEIRVVADLLVGTALKWRGAELDAQLAELGLSVSAAFQEGLPASDRCKRIADLATKACELLTREDRPDRPIWRPFHWLLEFPEVMLVDHSGGRGFEAMLGNPPFSYGTLATANLSERYMRCVAAMFAPWHGKSDICVSFLRRAHALTATPIGHTCLILSSSALRGETLESGLAHLVATGNKLVAARTPFLWPGRAGVEAIWVLFAHSWSVQCSLDGHPVDAIDVDLTPGQGASVDSAKELGEEDCLPGFLGVKLSPANRPMSGDVAASHLTHYPDLRAVIVPAIGGEQLYSGRPWTVGSHVVDPSQLPNLGAVQRRHLSTIVEVPLEDLKHARPAAELLAVLAKSRTAFACGETSVHLVFVEVPRSGAILKHKIVVFPADQWKDFTLLQSDIHSCWAWRWGLRRKRDLVYSPKRCAWTFPAPSQDLNTSALNELGAAFHSSRLELATKAGLSFTSVYNRYHSPEDTSREIIALRRLQTEMNNAVAAAYEWSDIALAHGFHATALGPRFGLSGGARTDVLARLLKLNQIRSSGAVAGLRQKLTGTPIDPPSASQSRVGVAQLGLFGDFGRRASVGLADAAPFTHLDAPARKVVQLLRKSAAALGKTEILAKSRIDEAVWAATIRQLKEAGLVEQIGEKRGATYRALGDD